MTKLGVEVTSVRVLTGQTAESLMEPGAQRGSLR